MFILQIFSSSFILTITYFLIAVKEKYIPWNEKIIPDTVEVFPYQLVPESDQFSSHLCMSSEKKPPRIFILHNKLFSTE